MNALEGFIIGYLIGIVMTFAGIMIFSKYMTNRETYIEAGRKKISDKKNGK